MAEARVQCSLVARVLGAVLLILLPGGLPCIPQAPAPAGSDATLK